jgi:hypothetical protein
MRRFQLSSNAPVVSTSGRQFALSTCKGHGTNEVRNFEVNGET